MASRHKPRDHASLRVAIQHALVSGDDLRVLTVVLALLDGPAKPVHRVQDFGLEVLVGLLGLAIVNVLTLVVINQKETTPTESSDSISNSYRNGSYIPYIHMIGGVYCFFCLCCIYWNLTEKLLAICQPKHYSTLAWPASARRDLNRRSTA
jgi:hypothetical protein